MRKTQYLWSFTNETKAQFWSKGTSQCYLSHECKNEFVPDNLINNEKLANITLPEKFPNDIFRQYAILAAGILNAQTNYYHSRPQYPYHILLLILKGKLSCRFDETRTNVGEKMLITIPAGRIFEESVKAKNCEVLWIHIMPSPVWNRAFGNKIGILKSKNFDDLKSVLYMLKREIYNEKRSIFFIENMISIFAELLKRELSIGEFADSKKAACDERADSVKNYPERIWNRKKAAQTLKCGASEIDAYFKNRHYCTFAKFVLKTRMDKTLALLTKKRLNFSEIAKSVGYADQSALSKAFKKYFGKSLKKYMQIAKCET